MVEMKPKNQSNEDTESIALKLVNLENSGLFRKKWTENTTSTRSEHFGEINIFSQIAYAAKSSMAIFFNKSKILWITQAVIDAIKQWFSNCGTRTTLGTRRPSRWYAIRLISYFSSQKIYLQLYISFVSC